MAVVALASAGVLDDHLHVTLSPSGDTLSVFSGNFESARADGANASDGAEFGSGAAAPLELHAEWLRERCQNADSVDQNTLQLLRNPHEYVTPTIVNARRSFCSSR